MQDRRPLIVVGYDGSQAAREAVDLAARRAAPDGQVVIVHAYEMPADYVGAPYYQEMLDMVVVRAEQLMRELTAGSGALAAVAWETDIVGGPPGEAICRAAEVRDADEIVMGTRGLGRFRAALGSVSADVLHHASCPVVIVPDRMVRAGRREPVDAAAS